MMRLWVTVGVVLSLTLVCGSARPRAQSSTIAYFIAEGTEARGFRAGDRQLAAWALEDWHRALPGVRFEPAAEHEALIRLYWTEASEGRYGEMLPLTVGGRQGAAVFIQPDVNALGDEIAVRARRDDLLRDSVVYLTCLHELGHALGLQHTADFRDIMYFFGFGGDILDYFDRYRRQLHSRSDIATISGLSEADKRRVAAMDRR